MKILSKLFIRNVDDVENEGFTVADHTGVIGDVDVEKAPADYEIEENTYFTSKEELVNVVSLVAIKKHFQMIIKKSNQTAYVVGCFEENYTWMLHASKYKGQNLWKIRNTILVTLAHPTSSTVTTVKATSKMVRSCVRSLFMKKGGEKTDPWTLLHICEGSIVFI